MLEFAVTVMHVPEKTLLIQHTQTSLIYVALDVFAVNDFVLKLGPYHGLGEKGSIFSFILYKTYSSQSL